MRALSDLYKVQKEHEEINYQECDKLSLWVLLQYLLCIYHRRLSTANICKRDDIIHVNWIVVYWAAGLKYAMLIVILFFFFFFNKWSFWIRLDSNKEFPANDTNVLTMSVSCDHCTVIIIIIEYDCSYIFYIQI